MGSSDRRDISKQRMVEAAGAAFRTHGLGGIGVDGLAKAANLTSGAFYFHFSSKLEAFIESVRESLSGLRSGIEQFQETEGAGWVPAFTSFYLGFKRTCDLGDGCALPLLSSEVERAGDPARSAYEEKMLDVFKTIEQGLHSTPEMTSREQSLALLALLAGGVMMSRTMRDAALSEEIVDAVKKAVSVLGISGG